jgi:hypothetical protein
MNPTTRKRVMTSDDEFREQFRHMRKTHSVGVILGLLAEVVKDEADAEFVAGNFQAEDQTRIVLGTLYTMTVGVDAVRYRPTREA